MNLDDLDYSYPSELVATEPQRPSRVLMVENCRREDFYSHELSIPELLDRFKEGDLLLINDTKVNKRRVYSDSDLEILFIEEVDEHNWYVLFPAKKVDVGDLIRLPDGVELRLKEKGLPQKVWVSKKLNESYFENYGEFALPPYIQKARGDRKNKLQDQYWYQTQWANKSGSTAAPTASLHFSQNHIQKLREKGVNIQNVTLHVGLGTFLPIRESDLSKHQMHSEYVEISKETIQAIIAAKRNAKTVWALGTTTTRAVESWAKNLLHLKEDGSFFGLTNLFITPEFVFEVVDVLMTNFHQPRSTLLALVASFSNLEATLKVYQEAIRKDFRLFSYGDLSVWARKDLRK
ncbi:MAG: tRNA preQ1(34) S-adenosylmethionine ribosyltransferase-isomerase QueA [Bdellovibrionales bacterium]|nr:tRNA preQ1(34) S-adenosylmethionine ribosyltransferase-isomerase QueA [Bdellovibrionales bacterium]